MNKVNLSQAIYATGRRKTAVARVWLINNGKGNIIVNNRAINEYFPIPRLEINVKKPLKLVNKLKEFDVVAKVKGGGISAQSDAIKLGIARTLVQIEEELKRKLKEEKLLTRDPREKERKKYGRKRARKKFQYSKR